MNIGQNQYWANQSQETTGKVRIIFPNAKLNRKVHIVREKIPKIQHRKLEIDEEEFHYFDHEKHAAVGRWVLQAIEMQNSMIKQENSPKSIRIDPTEILSIHDEITSSSVSHYSTSFDDQTEQSQFRTKKTCLTTPILIFITFLGVFLIIGLILTVFLTIFLTPKT